MYLADVDLGHGKINQQLAAIIQGGDLHARINTVPGVNLGDADDAGEGCSDKASVQGNSRLIETDTGGIRRRDRPIDLALGQVGIDFVDLLVAAHQALGVRQLHLRQCHRQAFIAIVQFQQCIPGGNPHVGLKVHGPHYPRCLGVEHDAV